MSKKIESCGWQGYGFGASYEDAACCGERVGDLDDCRPDGMIGLRDDVCPQCDGTGTPRRTVGPMALIRQRALNECVELCDMVDDADVREMLIEHFKCWHALVNKLECP